MPEKPQSRAGQRQLKALSDYAARLLGTCCAMQQAVWHSLTFLFCIVFLTTMQFHLPFTLQLVAWFGFCISGFHALFLRVRAFRTTTAVKKLDYYYLGITAFGVLLFAHANADQRQVLLSRFGIAVNHYFEEAARVDMVAEINGYEESACRNPVKTGKEYCTNARELIEWNKTPHTLQQLQKRDQELRNFIEHTGGLVPPEERLKSITSDDNHIIVTTPTPEDIAISAHLEQLYTDIEEQITAWTEPETMQAVDKSQLPKQFRDIMFAVSQLVLWPFVLATALGLRITKVTIEVCKWAE